MRTLEPRLGALADRQLELLAAIALYGGPRDHMELQSTLRRSAAAISQVRDALILKGDVYAPRRGELRFAVPVFAPYVLTHYETARGGRDVSRMLPIEEMRANAQGDVTRRSRPPRLPGEPSHLERSRGAKSPGTEDGR